MYEYHNPHPSALECCIRQPIGSVTIPSGAVVPTPEMEAAGVTSDVLAAFACPNLLRPTPAVVRRRLLQKAGAAIPENILAATNHLPEFGGTLPAPQSVPTPAVTPVPAADLRLRRQTRHQFAAEMESALAKRGVAPSLETSPDSVDTQKLADARCSSRPMRPVDPDAPKSAESW